MVEIRFPEPFFSVKKEDSKEWIYDGIRKKWVRLTPEEWVRQNFVKYLTEVKRYPSSLLSIEKGLVLGEVKKRCDILVYKEAQPWMIIECKEPGVSLTADVLMQAVRYNLANACCYLVISNGVHTLAWKIEKGEAIEISAIPEW